MWKGSAAACAGRCAPLPAPLAVGTAGRRSCWGAAAPKWTGADGGDRAINGGDQWRRQVHLPLSAAGDHCPPQRPSPLWSTLCHPFPGSSGGNSWEARLEVEQQSRAGCSPPSEGRRLGAPSSPAPGELGRGPATTILRLARMSIEIHAVWPGSDSGSELMGQCRATWTGDRRRARRSIETRAARGRPGAAAVLGPTCAGAFPPLQRSAAVLPQNAASPGGVVQPAIIAAQPHSH